MTVTIAKPGFLGTVQDAGRPGFAHVGVGRAGAFDAPAHRLANALADNRRDAAALEITLFGPTLHFASDCRIAVTGAPLPMRLDAAEVPMWAPLSVRAGQRLSLGAMRVGCRAYLAIHGGFTLPTVLGSRSTDLNAAIGPLGGRPLRAGDTLETGGFEGEPGPSRNAMSDERVRQSWSLNAHHWFEPDPNRPLRLLPGTHTARLDDASRDALFGTLFHVGLDSNRTGIRLEGPRLALATPAELVSEGCVPGTLQLPPSGKPIVLGVEGPVTGGYPRIGQVAAVDLPRLAQRRPGDALRFTSCTFAEALQALDARERALRRLEAAIALRLRGQVVKAGAE
ncbi:MAG: biotin-dependent carboxyltransferase family protein [Lysobacterales bacterium]